MEQLESGNVPWEIKFLIWHCSPLPGTSVARAGGHLLILTGIPTPVTMSCVSTTPPQAITWGWGLRGLLELLNQGDQKSWGADGWFRMVWKSLTVICVKKQVAFRKTGLRGEGMNKGSIKNYRKCLWVLASIGHNQKRKKPFASPLSLCCMAWCFPGLESNNSKNNTN